MSDITDAEARAALYGITDDQKIQAFGAYGIELDFAGGFYRNGYQIKATPADIDGWSFSRGSVAMIDVEGVVQSFPQDVPRIVANLGLAIEPAAQNLLLRSQQFDHVKWDKINVGSGLAPVVVADDATAPDGTMTADRISLSLDGGTGAGDRCHLQQDLAPVLDRCSSKASMARRLLSAMSRAPAICSTRSTAHGNGSKLWRRRRALPDSSSSACAADSARRTR
ncbi:hypothetical protein [Sphingopyxis sp. RIFCSPHIGHO2_12_FULL_65_19]|uniref:hypothetical protein n=1 Tax=Sphingopyxis sp. RIFCSPHIGHO2_12_FULL_65_19 TaxID=1802172 RepID=UPI0008C5AB92|nr:hypothetical protein [Sphingopyxis sp. RIFCSPHIGHO2_12_FULL_65_19]OHD07534.1 MAG: hypothetical protein A3E77_09105 [Sphingopyxis sp. RIFCSPHIGHO2_12_FULL_65_19]